LQEIIRCVQDIQSHTASVIYPVLYLNLGKAFYAAGKRKEAVENFEKGLTYDRGHFEIKRKCSGSACEKNPLYRSLTVQPVINTSEFSGINEQLRNHIESGLIYFISFFLLIFSVPEGRISRNAFDACISARLVSMITAPKELWPHKSPRLQYRDRIIRGQDSGQAPITKIANSF